MWLRKEHEVWRISACDVPEGLQVLREGKSGYVMCGMNYAGMRCKKCVNIAKGCNLF